MKSRLKEAFERNFRDADELGASVAVWKNGKELVSFHGGFCSEKRDQAWTEKTLVPVFSATKGAAAAALLMALHDGGGSPDMSVGELWPTFPMPYATIAQLLSHQCGLAAFDRQVSVFDHEACVRALEETSPAWQVPDHGYHPHTYGVMLDELMIRLTGNRLWMYWDENIRRPLNLDFYLMLPESEYARVAPLYPGKMDKSNLDSAFYREYLKRGTPIHRAFNTLIGLNSVRQMNTPAAWTCGSPAFGGVASASGMARFYQACLGFGDKNVLPEVVRTWLRVPVVDGPDLTMKTPTAFACGMMLDPLDAGTGRPLRHLFGRRGFGHAGAGGSHAFADPESGISFGYAMNRMDLNVLPGQKTQRLVEALLSEI